MRATRLPPRRNTTGPHRARHSVFRHPATMPDKAGVEVYRYARRPVDSLVCIDPIRGTGNASVRSCCALYGYVSGSHVVHPRRRKSGPSCAPRLPRRRHWPTPHERYSALAAPPRSCRIDAPRTSVAIRDPGRRRRLRVNRRLRQCEAPGDGSARVSRHANASVDRIDIHTRLVASASIPSPTKMPKSA